MWLFRDKPKTADTDVPPPVRRTEITVEREIISILTAFPSVPPMATACPTCGQILSQPHTHIAASPDDAPVARLADPANHRGDL